LLDSLLSRPTTSFAGQYYQLSAAERGPKPVQSLLPPLIGAAPSRMLHRHRAGRPSMER
jgi:alkanesulfonate monooxygenase SsuD/methylene tetrahydromethanopterin reductase-like flavin-dependent oxidoreductase (luciferase family)